MESLGAGLEVEEGPIVEEAVGIDLEGEGSRIVVELRDSLAVVAWNRRNRCPSSTHRISFRENRKGPFWRSVMASRALDRDY